MSKGRSSILLITPSYAPELTGVGRYTGELARGLMARGYHVEVIAPPPHYPGWYVRPPYKAGRFLVEWLDGIRILRCPIFVKKDAGGVVRLLCTLSFAVSSAFPTFWHIVRRRPNILLCVEPTLAVTPVALFAGWIVGARTVLHIQDLELDAALAVGHLRFPRFVLRMAYMIESKILRKFSRLVTISTKMAEAIRAKGVSADKIVIVRNWVNTDEIGPMTGLNSYRKELFIDESTIVCLYAGQIGRKQALHLVLEAAQILEKDKRFYFVIAGEGPEKSNLEKRFGSLSNVKFLQLQPESKLCALLNLADFHLLPQDANVSELVLPSKLGGMLASGGRILVTADQDTELAEFLDGSAILVKPNSVNEIVEGLRNALTIADTSKQKRLSLAESISMKNSIDMFDKVLCRL